MRSMTSTSLLNYLIIAYAFSIPVSLDLLRIFGPFIFIIWLVEGGLKEKFIEIKKEPVFKAIGLLILILLLSLFWTEPQNLKFGFKYVTRFWYLLPMFAIFTSLKKTYIPYTITAFLAGMSVSVIASYLVYFHLVPFENFRAEGASPFMHHTLYSIFLAFSIALLFQKLLAVQKKSHILVYAILTLLFTLNLFINIGRAGQLLFFILGLIVLINHYKITVKTVGLSMLGIILSFYLIFTLSQNFRQKMELTYHNLTHVSYSTSLGARIGLNIVAKEIISKHPLLGVGAGDYLTEKSKIVDAEYPDRVYVRYLVHYHNQYAEFAVIAGIFGLFAYLLIWVQIGRIKIKDTYLRTSKYLFIMTFMTTSLIDAMFHLNRPLSLFALFLGLLLAQSRHERFRSSDQSNASN